MKVKIVVFAPKTHTDIVRQAMGDAGAGRIGNYSHCSFSVNGVGRWKPMDGAKPYIGEVGKFEEAIEERIECECDRSIAKIVVESIRKVHPYEKVAFDIMPLILEEEL